MRALAILGIVVLAGALAVGGIYAVNRHSPGADLGQRATAAYNAGDYKTAVPLLKQWAETMNPNTDKEKMGKVLLELEDAKAKLNGTPVADTSPTTPTASMAATPTTPPTPTNAAGAPVAVVDTGDETIDPSTGKPRVPHATPTPGQTLQLTIKELGNFEFDATKNTSVPPDVQALTGAKVRLRGFMIPMTQADTITEFAFVPSLVGCCFGQPPGVQHTITCNAPAGKAVQYTVDEIWVEGKLKVNVQRDDGYTYSIFTVEVESVKTVE